MNSKKNSCRGNYMRKYGMYLLDCKMEFYFISHWHQRRRKKMPCNLKIVLISKLSFENFPVCYVNLFWFLLNERTSTLSLSNTRNNTLFQIQIMNFWKMHIVYYHFFQNPGKKWKIEKEYKRQQDSRLSQKL